VKELENGRLYNCERGHLVGAHLVGGSMMKTAILLGALRATVSKESNAQVHKP
jgi:hypothetical protein